MKKEWNNPKLEVLDVNMTSASTVTGPYTDEAYVPGVSVDDLPPNTYRFTS